MNLRAPEQLGMAPVTIVIVSYQSATSILDTLDSVERCHAEGLARCVVVDNASSDATPGLVQRHAPWAELIECDRNHGFARGCNIGLDTVSSAFTLFLNPDAQIEPGALRALLGFLSSRVEVGVVGPATICRPGGADEVLQLTGPLPSPRTMLPRRLARLLGEPASRAILPGEHPFETGWICGAVFLARTALLKQLGGFDPGFFLYWEETDLCFRVKQAGYQVWAVGTATGHHAVGVSSRDDPCKINGCIAKHYYESRRLYMLKHYSWSFATLAEAVEWAWIAGSSVLDAMRGRGFARLRPRLEARLFGLPADARRVEQSG